MVDTKVSDETAATTPTGAEEVRIVQGGSSKKTTAKVLSHQFRGARAKMTSDDTTQNIQAADTAISFDATDFDTDSFWSAGSPTRLTIPANVAYVEVTGQLHVTSSTGDSTFSLSIYHYNSSNVVQKLAGCNRFVEMGGSTKVLNVFSGPIAVSSGDYFTLMAKEETDNSLTIEGDNAVQTYLALTVLGMTA